MMVDVSFDYKSTEQQNACTQKCTQICTQNTQNISMTYGVDAGEVVNAGDLVGPEGLEPPTR